ncbi:MAG TPA: glycosyltransferase family 4 protein [Acidimicrobiia bacterium]|nr:glycosyltransferase family 4 protein [Acidimicrobiia bacterium]
MSPLRVGVVCPYDLSVPGGVQAQVLGLARYLENHGDRAVVIGPGLPGHVSGVDLGRSVSVPGNGSMVPISLDPRGRRRIRAAAADLDLLHVHEPLMPLASWFAVHAGRPVVATFHAAPGFAGRLVYRLLRPVLGWAMGETVLTTAVSEAAASVLPSGFEVRIIPNGLDVASMRVDATRNPARVVFLGRDESRKGLDVLLDAWPAVLAHVPDAELHVVNADRGLDGITWWGRVDEATKAGILSSASVYVAPHTGGESFGIVLVEAMAAGAAIVASDLAPFRAVAQGCARLFPVGDSVALARAIVELLHDPEQRARLTAAGAATAEKYDWSVVGATYRRLYGEMVS